MLKPLISALLTTLAASALAADYYVVVPVQGRTEAVDPISVSLQAASLPAATVGQAYSHNLRDHLLVTGDNALDLNQATLTTADALPSGLSLAANGLLSGTPTVKNEAGSSFQVTASYKTRSGQQVYTLVVNGLAYEVLKVEQGGMHGCALLASRKVMCWGYANSSGALGSGDTTSSMTPRLVVGLSNVVDISTGHDHSCALTAGGAAKCWGSNSAGRLGDGTTNNRFSPVQVTGMSSGVTKIAAGAASTCAIQNGGAKCWGGGYAGKLGNGSTSNSTTPVQVSGLTSGVTDIDIDLGMHSACAVHDGAAKCWGSNDSGQLGNNSNTNSSVPVGVNGMQSGVTDIDVGSSHACAVQNGAVKCWGANGDGQLGNGSTTTSAIAVQTTGLNSGVTAISAGVRTTCALLTTGAVKCWGQSSKLGTGATSNSLSPSDLTLTGVTGLTVGNLASCALTTAGETLCWGNGGTNGTGTLSATPTPVLWP